MVFLAPGYASKVFQVPLQLIVQQEGTVIPKLVSQCVKYLEKGNPPVDGVCSLVTPPRRPWRIRFVSNKRTEDQGQAVEEVVR